MCHLVSSVTRWGLTSHESLGEKSSWCGKVNEEYLTIAEIAARLKVKPKTVKNKMASGIFRKGVHYFSPQGLGPRFKWSAVVAWLEETQNPEVVDDGDLIPMPRSYRLREVGPKKVSIAS